MAIKEILVHLDNNRGHETRLKLAIAIAERSKAHIVALYGFDLPSVPPPISNLATGGYVTSDMERNVYIRERDAAFDGATQFERAFRAETSRFGLAGDWLICPDKPAELITLVTERARYADLALIGQADPDHPLFDSLARLPEMVMMGCGRPALIVPYAGGSDTIGNNVLVAWSGTREAARAVSDALPFLQTAEAVTVLSIGPTGAKEDGDKPAVSLARYLQQHDIHAEASHLVSDDIQPGELILSRAADLGCDLIVMGGYGHSRVRELILGGVTRAVLQHMTVPVLMSH